MLVCYVRKMIGKDVFNSHSLSNTTLGFISRIRFLGQDVEHMRETFSFMYSDFNSVLSLTFSSSEIT